MCASFSGSWEDRAPQSVQIPLCCFRALHNISCVVWAQRAPACPPRPSSNTRRSWPRSRGLVLEKKIGFLMCLTSKAACFFLEMDRVKCAFKGIGIRWRPAEAGRHGAARQMFYVYMFVGNAFFWLRLCTLILIAHICWRHIPPSSLSFQHSFGALWSAIINDNSI